MKIVSGEKPLTIEYMLAEPDAKPIKVMLVPNQEYLLPDDACIVNTEPTPLPPTEFTSTDN